MDTPEPYIVAALYHFVKLEDFEDLREPLLELTRSLDLRGTLLLAHEGLNGTVSGSRESIDALLAWLRKDVRFAGIVHKESLHREQPFLRMKVKLRKEIVTMGVEDIDPNEIVGTYVAPKDWNALISDPEVTVVDTRNQYEITIGTFKNAIDPETETFREFPNFVENKLDPQKHKKVAMFCTGGIRCEKSTAYLKQQGFEEVYHLQGGILKYFEEVPKEESLWEGECFVFDTRVAVNHDLEKGQYDQCYACRYPVTEEDKKSKNYVKGVSCDRCIDYHDDEKRAGFMEREKQMKIAAERGTNHIGIQRPLPNKLKRKQAKG